MFNFHIDKGLRNKLLYAFAYRRNYVVFLCNVLLKT